MVSMTCEVMNLVMSCIPFGHGLKYRHLKISRAEISHLLKVQDVYTLLQDPLNRLRPFGTDPSNRLKPFGGIFMQWFDIARDSLQ